MVNCVIYGVVGYFWFNLACSNSKFNLECSNSKFNLECSNSKFNLD